MIVGPPAVPLLTTGTVCYPSNSNVFAMSARGKGVLFVMGSWMALSDQYYELEENPKLFGFIVRRAQKPSEYSFPSMKAHAMEADPSKRAIPNIEALSEKLLSCVQETPSISHNFMNNFHNNVFEANFNMLPEALKTFDKLNVPYAPLKLIPPIYETPMLGLTPSVFPTILVELDPPKLELFDLDDEFANQEFA